MLTHLKFAPALTLAAAALAMAAPVRAGDPYAGYRDGHRSSDARDVHRHRTADRGFVVVGGERDPGVVRRTITFDPVTTPYVNTDSTRLIDARRLAEARTATGFIRPERAITVIEPAAPQPRAKAFLRPDRFGHHADARRDGFDRGYVDPSRRDTAADTQPGWGRIRSHRPGGDDAVYEINRDQRPNHVHDLHGVNHVNDLQSRIDRVRRDRLRARAARDIHGLTPRVHDERTVHADAADRVHLEGNRRGPAHVSSFVRPIDRVTHANPGPHVRLRSGWTHDDLPPHRSARYRHYHPHLDTYDHSFHRYRRSVLLRHDPFIHHHRFGVYDHRGHGFHHLARSRAYRHSGFYFNSGVGFRYRAGFGGTCPPRTSIHIHFD